MFLSDLLLDIKSLGENNVDFEKDKLINLLKTYIKLDNVDHL